MNQLLTLASVGGIDWPVEWSEVASFTFLAVDAFSIVLLIDGKWSVQGTRWAVSTQYGAYLAVETATTTVVVSVDVDAELLSINLRIILAFIGVSITLAS